MNLVLPNFRPTNRIDRFIDQVCEKLESLQAEEKATPLPDGWEEPQDEAAAGEILVKQS